MENFIGNEKQNEIRIFENEQFGKVRIVMSENDEPLFCAKDVCDVLGYKSSRNIIAQHVDNKYVTRRETPTANGNQMMTYISEPGLYHLVLSSKMENAKPFKRWIINELIKASRKTKEELVEEFMKRSLEDPDYLIEELTKYKERKNKGQQ